MQINLSECLNTEKRVETREIPYEKTTFHNGYAEYTLDNVSPIQLKIENMEKGKVMVTGALEIELKIPCDRCLTPVPTKIEVCFEREVYAPERIEDDQDQQDDQAFMDGYQMELDVLLEEEIMMNWPLKTLCKEDCKGLCKVCGKNRNEEECDCDDFVPDPRMAVIADLF